MSNQNKNNIMAIINPLHICKRYKIPILQCPQFLFLVMGVVIIAVIVVTYYLAALKVGDPRIVSLIELVVASILMIIDYVIVNSFERMAEASRMKTEFIGIVSHQLRSPLTNIKFSLDILLSGEVKERGENEIEYLKILRENAQRMGDLINDLLLVSRLETGEFPLKNESVSLKEITEALVKKFSPFADASNVEVDFESSEKIPFVRADSLWLEQVVKNLLDNAIRYVKGRGKVEINIFDKKKEVFFKIKDTGVGIPKNEQKFVFQKFFRSKNAVRHQTEGSGLGLHIVKKIIDLFGGRIWFESEEGEGTTFYFTLPVVKTYQ